MIKSRIISILLSGCLLTGIGVGNFLIKSKDTNEIESSKKTYSIEEKENNSSNIVGQVDDNKSKNEINSEENKSNSEENILKENSNRVSNEEENTTNLNNGTSNETSKETEKNTPVIVEENYTEVAEENNLVEVEKEETPTPSKETSTTPKVEASDSFIAEIEQAIFTRVNKERTAAGLPALSYNNTMEHYARLKSQDMGNRGYFDHKNPEGQLITAQMQADGVSYRAWGENIAYISGVSGNSQLATKFMDNWMNSSGHRANILSSNFSSIGIGVYKIGSTYYATQEFYK